jgi:uncharacterized protein (DUF849 family)
MPAPTILTCAVTGNITTASQNPALPITPRQIAESSIEAANAGAAIVHIHVRHPDTGEPSMCLDHYREVVDRLRESGVDLIINLTTGPGARFVPGDEDPRIPAAGSTLVHALRRVEHIAALQPEICSLDLNTMFSGTSVVMNTPGTVVQMARVIREAGVMPELEVFDSGDIHLARHLLSEGHLASPPLFQLVLGVRYGFQADPTTLLYARSLLPENARWAAFGVGRTAFPMLAQAFIAGGHCRIGLEDTVYISRGTLAPGNAALVEKAVRLVELLGGRIASPAEARVALGLRPPA